MAIGPDNQPGSDPSEAVPEQDHEHAHDVEIPHREGILKGLFILCALLFVLDFLIDRHPKVPGEGFPAFHALTGFIAFTLIVLGAKQLRRLIWRPENYYGWRSINGEDYRPVSGEEREGRYAQRGEDPDEGWANYKAHREAERDAERKAEHEASGDSGTERDPEGDRS